MADPRRESLKPYIRDLANRMDLKDWNVELEADPPGDSSALASVNCLYGRRIAIVRVSESFLRQPSEEQRSNLCHEMIHCHMEPAAATIRDLMTAEQWNTTLRLLEYAIDSAAEVVARGMPLPSATD